MTDAYDEIERLRAQRDELAADMAALTCLHQFSTRLFKAADLQSLLQEVLQAVMALQGADFGCVQILNPETRVLQGVAQAGFDPDFARRHRHAGERRDTACGRCLHSRERIVIPDVLAEPGDDGHRALALEAGYRALQCTPLFNAGGDVLGVLSTHFRRPHSPPDRVLHMTDLYARHAAEAIERKRAEAALRRSEAYLAEGQALTHTGSWALDVATGNVYWSQEHFRIFGLPPQAIRPTYPAVLEWVHPDDRALVQETFDAAVRCAGPYELEFRIVRADGAVRSLHSVANPVFGPADELVEYVGTIVDTTERRQVEEVLRRTQLELLHVARVTSMGELTASIAHELNQPLAAIAAHAGACLRWLKREVPDLDEARQAVERIGRDADRATRVLQEVRALTTNKPPASDRVDMNEAVRAVLDLMHSEIGHQQAGLRLDLGPALPPVRGDRILLQQAILNLIANGLEAMAEVNGRLRRLVIRSHLGPSAEVLLSVEDSGVGMDTDRLGRLFDPFFTTKAGGMGLGLSISRRIVEAHGGRLWAESRVGEGTVMTLSLPSQA
jgi:PAS domain S-box-containing protein